MKYKLSKLIGRNQLPGDEVAFDRLAKVFSDPIISPSNTQRRLRINIRNGKTKPSL